jgi:hypothetical protein
MPAAFQELYLEQGTTFVTTVTLDDVYGISYDLTNVVPKAQIRKSYYSANVAAEFDAQIPDPTVGVIVIQLDANTTSNIAAGRYVYDVAINDTANTTITRVLEGNMIVSPRVTRF